MTKTNQQLSQTRRDDADAMALGLGYRSKSNPERGSHRAMETAMLEVWRAGGSIFVNLDGKETRFGVRGQDARIESGPAARRGADAGESGEL